MASGTTGSTGGRRKRSTDPNIIDAYARIEALEGDVAHLKDVLEKVVTYLGPDRLDLERRQ